MRTRHEKLFTDQEVTTSYTTAWLDLSGANRMWAFEDRAFAFISNKATKITIIGSMDGVIEHKTILDQQALTADTIYFHVLADADRLFRYYQVKLDASASQPDTVSGWMMGREKTGY